MLALGAYKQSGVEGARKGAGICGCASHGLSVDGLLFGSLALCDEEIHVGVHSEADDFLVERFGQAAGLEVEAEECLEHDVSDSSRKVRYGRTHLSDSLVQLHGCHASAQTTESTRSKVQCHCFSHAENPALFLLASIARKPTLRPEDFAVGTKHFGIMHHAPAVPADLGATRCELLDTINLDACAAIWDTFRQQARHRWVDT